MTTAAVPPWAWALIGLVVGIPACAQLNCYIEKKREECAKRDEVDPSDDRRGCAPGRSCSAAFWRDRVVGMILNHPAFGVFGGVTLGASRAPIEQPAAHVLATVVAPAPAAYELRNREDARRRRAVRLRIYIGCCEPGLAGRPRGGARLGSRGYSWHLGSARGAA